MIRKIMVPVRSDGKSDVVLAHAAVLAHRARAHVEITHCRPRPEDLMPYGVPIPDFMRRQIIDQSRQVADLEEEKLRESIMELVGELGLVPADRANGREATVSFVEETGRQVDVIKRRGRLADVIAVAQPDRDRNLGANTLKSALFQSGRPVLMCPEPEKPVTSLGEHVALAWNGSAEAARALAQSMALIASASRVSVLTNGADCGAGTSANDVVAYLKDHDIGAKLVKFENKTRIGAILLSTCADIAADLLIMGAYGDSHERETLFGGNTQIVVDTARRPVLFSH